MTFNLYTYKYLPKHNYSKHVYSTSKMFIPKTFRSWCLNVNFSESGRMLQLYFVKASRLDSTVILYAYIQ